MYEDNVELAYLNKEIDKVKKQLEDRLSKYESLPTPNTQVGWASYIANNDRGLLDKYQDAERAWYNKLKDQEHSKELAKAQMEQQAAYRMDDNIKNRSLALNKLQYAQAALKNDTSNDPLIKAGLERDLRNAQEEVNYWNKAVGIPAVGIPGISIPGIKDDLPKDDTSKDDDNTTTEVKIEDYSSITKFKNQDEKDALLKEIESNPALNNNKALRVEYNRIKGIVPDDKKAADYKAKLDKWRNEYNALSPLQQRIWKKNNPSKAKAIGV